MEVGTYQAVRPVIVDGKVIAAGSRFRMPETAAADMLVSGQIEIAAPEAPPQVFDVPGAANEETANTGQEEISEPAQEPQEQD